MGVPMGDLNMPLFSVSKLHAEELGDAWPPAENFVVYTPVNKFYNQELLASSFESPNRPSNNLNPERNPRNLASTLIKSNTNWHVS